MQRHGKPPYNTKHQYRHNQTGIWFGKDDPRNIAIRVQDNSQSNNTGELSAILHVLQSTPKATPLEIRSDSEYAIEGIVWHSRKWEENGWIGVDNKDLFRAILSWNRARGARTEYKWVKGHSKEEGEDKEGNDGADELARIGTELPKSNYLPTGAQISKISQKTIYKGIKLTNPTPERHAIKEETGLEPTDERIWKSIRKHTNSRKIQIFLWKTIHDAYRCGKWWLNINNYEDRAKCKKCNEIESMDHILFACTAPGQGRIWSLAKAMFKKKTNKDLKVSMGLVLDRNHKIQQGASRLATILLTESAYLIWKIRCQPQKAIPQNAITNKWYAAINARLKTDLALTSKRLPASKRVKPELVLKTWSGVLDREHLLPDDWINWTGVLVGRLTQEPNPDPEPPPAH
ncbi:ribonuclease H-like protein [Irpex lacteus]|nr:ribonuclease H-like protein [Irpex lacteus]